MTGTKTMERRWIWNGRMIRMAQGKFVEIARDKACSGELRDLRRDGV